MLSLRFYEELKLAGQLASNVGISTVNLNIYPATLQNHMLHMAFWKCSVESSLQDGSNKIQQHML